MRRCRLATGIAITLLSCATAVPAGQLGGKLSGPMLGYVWNSNERALRPIFGIVGNSTIGEPVDLPFLLPRVLALNGRHFLAATDADATMVFLNMETAPPGVTAIPQAPAGFTLGVGSRRGSAAALYYADRQTVLLIAGLPGAPRVTQSLDISSTGALKRMAVSDDGRLLLYAVPEPERDSIYGWTPNFGHRRLTDAEAVSAIALGENGNAVIADAKSNEVFAILDARGSAARQFLADERSGISNPTGVTVADSNRIYVANADSRTIVALDDGGRVLRASSCNCEPSGLHPLKDSIYRLSERADRTIFLLEAGASRDRVAFVPMFLPKPESDPELD